MNPLCCALIALAAIAIGVDCKSMPHTVDRCAVMRCANGPCVNGKCTNNKCPPNMHEAECGSACPARCDLDPAASMCMALCVKGCFCNEGFVLDKAGGSCIRPQDCPKKTEKREDHTDKCALMRCSAGKICKDGKCIADCPMFKMVAPKPGCTYVNIVDKNGCSIPRERCTA